MAVATYNTDLASNVIDDCEDNTGWSELTNHTGGGADAQETDYFIQGNACVSQPTGNSTNVGLEFDYGSDMSSSMSAGYCFFVWHVFLAPGAINTWANGGLRFGVGSSSGNIDFWNETGNDYGRNPLGGWQNFAIDPTYTPDATEGSPTGAMQIFGFFPNMLQVVSKGNMHGVDIIRFGRGDLYVEYGEAGNYGTFAGMASANDAQSARWGLFQYQAGSYLWKGLMSLGTSSNAVDFRDSNRNIVIDDTPRTYASFNRIEINNASSNIEWTNINISALGTLSKGEFEAIDNATIDFTTCVFTDMSTFVFDTNSTLTVCTWRRCGLVTGGGATFDRCDFDSSTASAAVVVSDLDQVSACHFISDGSGHAVELTSVGDGTMTWSNTHTGYSGTSTDAALYVNVGSGTLDITVAAGADTPSIRTAGATVNIVTSVNLTMTVKDSSGSVIVGAYAYIDDNDITPFIMNTTTNGSGVATTTYSGSPVTGARWRVRKYGYKPFKQIIDIGSSDISIPVTLVTDPQQS